MRKWRPIQALVSLTDEQVEPQKGGFEAAKGFHLEFDTWAKERAPTQQPLPSSGNKGSTSKNCKKGGASEGNLKGKKNCSSSGASKSESSGSSSSSISSTPGSGDQSTGGLSQAASPPCVGEYTPIRPREDAAVLKRVEHVACRAGDLILWDNRIPHANSLHHLGLAAREAVFLGFLPAVPLNQSYASTQLEAFRAGVPPSDQWIEPTARGLPPPETQPRNDEAGHESSSSRIIGSANSQEVENPIAGVYEFSPLGRKLMAIDAWDSD